MMGASSAMLRLNGLCSRLLACSRVGAGPIRPPAAPSGVSVAAVPYSSSTSTSRYLYPLCNTAAISKQPKTTIPTQLCSYSTSSSAWHTTGKCPFSSGLTARSSPIVAASATATAAPPDAAAVSAAAPASSVVSSSTLPAADLPSYSMRQIIKHTTDESCWLLVDGKVYDVTSYLDDHPGGAESILLNTGVDASEEFNSIHSQEAKDLLQKFLIGTLKPAKKKAAATTTAEAVLEESLPAAAPPTASQQPPLLQLADPRTKYALPLVQKQQLNQDTFFLRFALASPQTRLGLPCGKHVYLFAEIGGETVARAYTPVSGDKDLGVLDFLIKVYWAGQHPAFPDGGKMTQHLARMQVGDTIDAKGPMGKFQYEGRGAYQLNRQPGKARYLSMVAGGSGITPCYAVLREVLSDPQDDTRCALIYANKQESDIWLRKELEELAAAHPDRLHLWYTLEQPPTVAAVAAAVAQEEGVAASAAAVAPAAGSAGPAWRYSRGYITKDMMAQHLLPSGPDSLALMCGPPGMLEQAVVPGLKELGYATEQMVVF